MCTYFFFKDSYLQKEPNNDESHKDTSTIYLKALPQRLHVAIVLVSDYISASNAKRLFLFVSFLCCFCFFCILLRHSYIRCVETKSKTPLVSVK